MNSTGVSSVVPSPSNPISPSSVQFSISPDALTVMSSWRRRTLIVYCPPDLSVISARGWVIFFPFERFTMSWSFAVAGIMIAFHTFPAVASYAFTAAVSSAGVSACPAMSRSAAAGPPAISTPVTDAPERLSTLTTILVIMCLKTMVIALGVGRMPCFDAAIRSAFAIPSVWSVTAEYTAGTPSAEYG